MVAALGGARGAEARAKLAPALADRPSTWEADLVAAAAEPDERARSARVNEQLLELEGLAGRWAGVPRVCARLSTSVGFLCAIVALLEGLSLATSDTYADDLHGALVAAVGSLATGIAGTSFCAAVHYRARKAAAAGAAAADRLVDAIVDPEAGDGRSVPAESGGSVGKA
jgi:hypothetical protein